MLVTEIYLILYNYNQFYLNRKLNRNTQSKKKKGKKIDLTETQECQHTEISTNFGYDNLRRFQDSEEFVSTVGSQAFFSVHAF